MNEVEQAHLGGRSWTDVEWQWGGHFYLHEQIQSIPEEGCLQRTSARSLFFSKSLTASGKVSGIYSHMEHTEDPDSPLSSPHFVIFYLFQ